MPQYYDPWVNYGGVTKIWLALGLLAIAAAAVYAGSRLPLPTQAARPGKKTAIIILVAWAAAIVALLAGVVLYLHQYIPEYQGTALPPPPDHVAPVTFLAFVAVFIIILARGPGGGWQRLASAAIGAIAAPFIFELPFDLIIMTRIHGQFPTGRYVPVLLGLLLLVDITTLLLLRLSPRVRLTRATFYALALMLAVFAVWGLAGFGYPSAPLPLTLNIVSKLLAFATALTLFFPQRPPAPASTPDRSATSELMKI